MAFKVGKYYQHNSGTQLYIYGKMKTHTYGECFIGIYGIKNNILYNTISTIQPIGMGDGNSENFYEIKKTDFYSKLYFYEDMILTDGYSLNKYYKNNNNKYIYIVSKMFINKQLAYIFEQTTCNDSNIPEIGILTNSMRDFNIEVSNYEFLLESYALSEKQRIIYSRVLKLNKLRNNG